MTNIHGDYFVVKDKKFFDGSAHAQQERCDAREAQADNGKKYLQPQLFLRALRGQLTAK